jgi:Coenzyme PQQ synthesis protein D (PqqD)
MLRNPNQRDGCLLPKPGEPLLVRSRSVVSRVIAGETLIVPVRGKVGDLASIYSFNGTGSLIWQLLESPKALTDLIRTVELQYEVGEEQAQGDVTRFVNEMLSVELVNFCPPVARTAIEIETEMGETQSKVQEMLETADSC